MNLFAPILAKAGKALSLAENEVTMARAALDAHDMTPADAGEATAILAHRRRREELAEALEVAESVVLHWQSVIATEEAKAAESAAAEETRRIDREAEAAQKRVRDMFALQEKLAALRNEHVAHVEAVAAYNAGRGTRAYISDAEERVRQTPARTTPAVFEERELWVDADGNQPTFFKSDERGNQIPAEHRAFSKKVVSVCVTAERFEPARMPERLADVMHLVDLSGRPL